MIRKIFFCALIPIFLACLIIPLLHYFSEYSLINKAVNIEMAKECESPRELTQKYSMISGVFACKSDAIKQIELYRNFVAVLMLITSIASLGLIFYLKRRS